MTTSRGYGFDEAAIDAGRELLFDAATRNGHPIAARIKFRYTFTLLAPELVGRVLRLTDSAPIPNAVVTVRDAANREHTVTTVADGTWSLHRLSPGRDKQDVSSACVSRMASRVTQLNHAGAG